MLVSGYVTFLRCFPGIESKDFAEVKFKSILISISQVTECECVTCKACTFNKS